MAKFAKSSTQAEKAVRANLALGAPRHGNRKSGKIHSVGTARNFASALKKVADWMKECRLGHGLPKLTAQEAMRFLVDQASQVKQATLDQYRQAVEKHLGLKFERIKSEAATSKSGRAYSNDQVRAISNAQAPHNKLATEIAREAGIRAHELHTLGRFSEQPPSAHREWDKAHFAGRENWSRYTVVGKGGLTREVRLPTDLASRLEETRKEKPTSIRDRRINYQKRYTIGGGNAWSKSVSKASKKVLGWSNGAHGFRYAYAQERMGENQKTGFSYHEALARVAQELGHFAPSTTEVYLR